MDKIPAEILCDIFRDTLPEWDGRDIRDIPYSASVSAPVYISHVCRFWRRIALSCGDLWAHLCIDYEKANHWGTRRTKWKIAGELFDTWLSRTNGFPLSYLFRSELNKEDDPELHEISRHIIEALIAEQHRWKDIHLSWCDGPFSPDLGHIELSNMPMLTSLVLSVWTHRHSPPLVIDLSGSSGLRRLILRCDYNLVTGGKTLQSLTEPSMLGAAHVVGRQALQSCLSMLRSAPHLTELVASFRNYSLFTPSSSESLIVCDLRLLKLTGSATLIIDSLTLPFLEALSHSFGCIPGQPLLRFFRRSLPPLTFLDIDASRVTEVHIILILRLLPLLRYLKLLELASTMHLSRELTVSGVADGGNSPPGEHVLCRSLVSICLGQRDSLMDVDASVDALITMAQSRCTALGTFKRVKFRFTYGGYLECDLFDIDEYIDHIRHSFKELSVTFTRDRVPPDPFTEFIRLV